MKIQGPATAVKFLVISGQGSARMSPLSEGQKAPTTKKEVVHFICLFCLRRQHILPLEIMFPLSYQVTWKAAGLEWAQSRKGLSKLQGKNPILTFGRYDPADRSGVNGGKRCNMELWQVQRENHNTGP